MNTIVLLMAILATTAFLISPISAFVTPPSAIFPLSHADVSTTRGSTAVYGGKQAKFGVFSPAVYGAKLVLGENKLKNIRGKAISLHSGYIGDFCKWLGSYHLRTLLIKKAKTNGDILGFLV